MYNIVATPCSWIRYCIWPELHDLRVLKINLKWLLLCPDVEFVKKKLRASSYSWFIDQVHLSAHMYQLTTRSAVISLICPNCCHWRSRKKSRLWSTPVCGNLGGKCWDYWHWGIYMRCRLDSSPIQCFPYVSRIEHYVCLWPDSRLDSQYRFPSTVRSLPSTTTYNSQGELSWSTLLYCTVQSLSTC